MVNGVSDLKYMCARRVSDLFSSQCKENYSDGYTTYSLPMYIIRYTC